MDRDIRQDPRQALALRIEQRLDADCGAFADQDNAGTADGAENGILGARVDCNGLVFGDPAALEGTQGSA